MSENLSLKEQIEADLTKPFLAALEKEGVTPEFLAKKLKAELKAKEVKAQVPKGASEFVYSKPMIAWDVRQKARMDAHKLLGHYPAEKHELTGKGGGPIENKFTNFPPEPKTLDEWQKQMEEAEKARLQREGVES